MLVNIVQEKDTCQADRKNKINDYLMCTEKHEKLMQQSNDQKNENDITKLKLETSETLYSNCKLNFDD